MSFRRQGSGQFSAVKNLPVITIKLTTRIAYSIFPSYVWSILKEESKLTWCRWSAHWPEMRWSYDQLKKNGHLKIHLGCGDRSTPGWINIDARRDAKSDLRRDL